MTKIDIHVTEIDAKFYVGSNTFYIGSVEAPFDTPDFDPDEWIHDRWMAWQEEEAEADSEFIGWLVENHGCTEIAGRHQVYLER